MNPIFQKLSANPIKYSSHILYKYLIAPLKYNSRNDYKTAQYWMDRFKKHGSTLIAVGDEGLSLMDNQKMYDQAAGVFKKLLIDENISFQNKTVLEIGVGNGFFTQIIYSDHPSAYTGIDITDTLFGDLRTQFPGFHFHMQDVTTEPIQDAYDIILFIDVIEHIVNSKKMIFALNNIRRSLKPGGVLIFAPFMKQSKKEHFHLRMWSYNEIAPHLNSLAIGPLVPFRRGYISIIRKKNG